MSFLPIALRSWPVIWLLGCTPQPVATVDGEVKETPGDETSRETSTQASSESGAEDEGEDSGSSGATGFIHTGDVTVVPSCDPWAQDCPTGEKCVPYRSPGGSSWDANRCVPVVDDPDRPGETCEEIGESQSGLDTCDENSTCFYIRDGKGLCLSFCTGSAERPGCANPQEVCPIDSDGTIILCRATCDPLASDCLDSERQSCIYQYGVDDFMCELGWGEDGIKLGETCVYDNSCLAGTLCFYNPSRLIGCEGDACCTGYCDQRDPKACADQPGTICEPFFADEVPPPDLSYVGICLVPEN